jgi:predicted metal-dependent hydrolase
MHITLLTGKTSKIKSNFDFELEVKTSFKAKRISLKIDAKKKLPIVTMPKFCSANYAIDFIKRNQKWIEESLNKIPEKIIFSHGDEIFIMGQIYEINHMPDAKAGVWLEDGKINVSGGAEFLNSRLRNFVKKVAKNELSKLARNKAKSIKCYVNKISIKDTKTRWGSCSTKSNINFSWRIVLAPAEVIDYLISHEVCHLIHHNHSKEFWADVEKLAINMKGGKEWLKENGNRLFSYF